MLIGLDFDNTIVCYDYAIAKLADEMFDLPKELPRTKISVRNFLRDSGREIEWTSFQGLLYGPGMEYAYPFDGVIEGIQILREVGHSFCIVSHRSLYPYAGTSYNLHLYARKWVTRHLVSRGIIEQDKVFLLDTLDKKVAAISDLDCQIFIDDLPEVILHKAFPQKTAAVLFDPTQMQSPISCAPTMHHWKDLQLALKGLSDSKRSST